VDSSRLAAGWKLGERLNNRTDFGLATEHQLIGEAETGMGIEGFACQSIKVSEEYPMSFVLSAIACLLGLGFVFSRIRAKQAAKPEIPKLFQ
jgi:hypothetical protein